MLSTRKFLFLLVAATIAPSLQLSSIAVGHESLGQQHLQQQPFLLGQEKQQEQHRTNNHHDVEQGSLAQFESALRLLPTQERSFLDKALARIPSVAKDPNFRIMFLRSEKYKAEAAARLFAKYWENRVNLFGEAKAFLPLTQDGALKDDIEALSHGYVRAVPGHPRMVLMDPSRTPKDYNIDSVVRSVLYVLEKCLSQSEEMQRKGAVIVLDFGKVRSFDRKLFAKLDKYMNQGFPFRPSARCIIRASPVTSWVIRILQMVSREKLHVARTSDDLEQVTGAVGVQESVLFGNDDDEAVDHHQKWLDCIRQRESSSPSCGRDS